MNNLCERDSHYSQNRVSTVDVLELLNKWLSLINPLNSTAKLPTTVILYTLCVARVGYMFRTIGITLEKPLGFLDCTQITRTEAYTLLQLFSALCN